MYKSSIISIVSAAAISVLSGCTVGPRYHAPAPPSVGAYTPEPQPTKTVESSGRGGTAQTLKPSSEFPVEWWTVFQSPQLNEMVSEALASSPTLAQANARLRQAQEEANAQTGAAKYPTVTGSAGIQQEQVNLATFGVPFPNPSPFTLLNGSVAVSYALDIFGAKRRLIEGLNAQVEFQDWQLQGARLMLAGNVASAAIRQAQVHAQINATRGLLALQEQSVKIAEQRFAAGGVTEYDVRSQRRALAEIQASLPPLEQQFDSLNHQLAYLMGKTPAEARIAVLSLDDLHLPEELPVSVPSELVRQRPDIRAAEALLHQASANVGVATANLYPQIVISGSAGGIGTSFLEGGPVWNVGASLSQPIFNGGSLRAEKRKAAAAYDEAGATYRQTVLESFRQVADVLRAIEHDAQALQSRTEAVSQAEGAYEIASKRYAAGGISQVALLDAQRGMLQTKLDRIASQASRYTDSVTLLQALGGGWWNASQNSLHAVGSTRASTK